MIPLSQRSHINAGLTSLQEELKPHGSLCDQVSLDIQLWMKKFKEDLRLYKATETESILSSNRVILQEILTDPRGLPLDENSLLGHDGYTYTEESLAYYQNSPLFSLKVAPHPTLSTLLNYLNKITPGAPPRPPKKIPVASSQAQNNQAYYVGKKQTLNITDDVKRAKCGDITYFREIAGDGSCFYTSLATGLLESCCINERIRLSLLTKINEFTPPTGLDPCKATVRTAISNVRLENLELALADNDIIHFFIVFLRALTAQSIRDSIRDSEALDLFRRSLLANFEEYPEKRQIILTSDLTILLNEFVLKMNSYAFQYSIGKTLESLNFSVWLIDLENMERLPGALGPQAPEEQCCMHIIRIADHFIVGYKGNNQPNPAPVKTVKTMTSKECLLKKEFDAIGIILSISGLEDHRVKLDKLMDCFRSEYKTYNNTTPHQKKEETYYVKMDTLTLKIHEELKNPIFTALKERYDEFFKTSSETSHTASFEHKKPATLSTKEKLQAKYQQTFSSTTITLSDLKVRETLKKELDSLETKERPLHERNCNIQKILKLGAKKLEKKERVNSTGEAYKQSLEEEDRQQEINDRVNHIVQDTLGETAGPARENLENRLHEAENAYLESNQRDQERLSTLNSRASQLETETSLLETGCLVAEERTEALNEVLSESNQELLLLEYNTNQMIQALCKRRKEAKRNLLFAIGSLFASAAATYGTNSGSRVTFTPMPSGTGAQVHVSRKF